MNSQYYENTLRPVALDSATLHQVLVKLRHDVKRATDMIKANAPEPSPDDSNGFGSIFNGALGIGLMFFRLQGQAAYLADSDDASHNLAAELYRQAGLRISQHTTGASHLRPGRLAPVESATLAPPLMRIAAAVAGPTHQPVNESDINILQSAVDVALNQGSALGHDEALYGRAGLIWAILYIRQLQPDERNTAALTSLFEKIPKLISAIVDVGKLGATEYSRLHGDHTALPLMWPWKGKYYIGAIHGIAGILAILLACKPSELQDSTTDHLPIIAQTITGLCKLSIKNNGHLPSSLPVHPTSHASPLVQICHGSPGLLLLLAQARSTPLLTSSFWEPYWDQAILLGTQRVWEEGILLKGGGICHGIAGNAWPLLMLHDSFEYHKGSIAQGKLAYKDRTGVTPPEDEVELSGGYFLSRALALLLYAEKTRPFDAGGVNFRMPDTPFGMFEGLAGTCTAWAEACVVIQARLRKEELDEKGDSVPEKDEILCRHLSHELGFPGLSLGTVLR
ncbi:hypothetical protein FQN53_000855 [Emmonsiellopsis sp. PD_33]|nr:hypothetical protein FQN53_000855 [Emmonsiellopsis sp. PD_33]KAK2800989.1 hypothetical protein FQN51_005552 [Onygenales sp. PD_10]